MAGNWGVCTVCSPPSAQFGLAARLEKGPVHFSPHPSNRVGHPALYQCTGPDCEWGCHVPPCTAFSEPANLHINRKAASSFQHLLEFFADLPAPWVPLGNLPWTWKKEVMRRTALALLGSVAAYGLICFFRQGIPDYLFLRTEFAFFDYSLPPFTVLSQCVSIFSLWMLVGYLLRKGIQAWDRKVQRHRISKFEMY